MLAANDLLGYAVHLYKILYFSVTSRSDNSPSVVNHSSGTGNSLGSNACCIIFNIAELSFLRIFSLTGILE